MTRAGAITAAAVLLCACGGTEVLHETTPVAVTARPPPLPPPPPEPEPEPPPPPVVVEQTRIRVDEKIYFEWNRATIQDQSHGILDQIAQVINDHPELLKIQVEGHTDRRQGSSAAYNQRLSQQRAEAVVDYLVEHGVDRSRLVPRGFGFDRPVADNETEEGREQNRRVEFNITERAEPGQEPAAQPEQPQEEPAAEPEDASESEGGEP